MKKYVATFYTHLAAIRTQRALSALGLSARLAPVPRRLSASCGTCVLYCADAPHEEWMAPDTQGIYLVQNDSDYQILFAYE